MLAPATPESPSDLLIRKLEATAALGEADRRLLRGLPCRRIAYAAGEEISPEGEVPRPRLLVSGWACRLRYLPDGRRQIFDFILPGDTIGLSTSIELPAVAAVVALTQAETIDAVRLATAFDPCAIEHAQLARALRASAFAESARLADQMVRLGRQTAYERTAHLLLELYDRLTTVGRGGRQFHFPLTQEAMADSLGLSIVHVNRTVQQLRRDRLIVLKSGVAELLDVERLMILANFLPAARRSPPMRPVTASAGGEPRPRRPPP